MIFTAEDLDEFQINEKGITFSTTPGLATRGNGPNLKVTTFLGTVNSKTSSNLALWSRNLLGKR
jgi:hypothetical protein